jgi:hypothetical protein
MSRLAIGILGAFALAASLGAAQLALGGDLAFNGSDRSGAANVSVVNRAAKADRAAKAPASAVQTRTLSLQLNGLADTSFLVRVPAADGAARPPSLQIKPGNPGAMVACEPVVSPLTEVARMLEPGRCVT